MSLVLKAHNIKGVINLFEQRKTSRFDELSKVPLARDYR
jgi:hypothetical protein